MNNFILDSSAVLAFIQRERGGDKVKEIIKNSYLSTVNFSEIVSKLYFFQFSKKEVYDIIIQLEINLVDFDKNIAIDTGYIKYLNKKLGLSLGDCACIATAIAKNLDIVTADKIWLNLDLPVKVISIR